MKKTKFWTVPEVNFSCCQEKADNKTANHPKMTTKENESNSIKYLLHSLR